MSLRYGVERVPAIYGGYHWVVVDRNEAFRRTHYAGVRTAMNGVSMWHSEEAAQEEADTLNALIEL